MNIVRLNLKELYKTKHYQLFAETYCANVYSGDWVGANNSTAVKTEFKGKITV